MNNINGNDSKYVDYLNLSPLYWKRPDGPPQVWRVVEGRRKMADGQIPRFSIQEVPKDLEDDVVEFMVKYFLTEEPLAVHRSAGDDPIGVRESRTSWRHIVRQGVSVVALIINPDPTAKPVIAGVNLLYVTVPEKEAKSEGTLFRSEGMKKLIGVLGGITEESEVLKTYGVDRYLGAFGLSVLPSLRGQGLGEQILRARDDIGRAYQIPVSQTVFTATASQILADRAGYELLIERNYTEVLDDEGNLAFPGRPVKVIKSMAKKLY